MRTFLILITVLLIGLPASAQEHRLALVISQANYSSPDLSVVSSAENEGNLIENALRTTGFEVTRHRDLTQPQLKAALDEFRVRLDMKGRQGIGFIYYTGHGVQHPDPNHGGSFLLGVDTKLRVPSDLRAYGVDLAEQRDIYASMQSKAVFFVFDACRNVPALPGFKSATKGLSPVSSLPDMLIAYATNAGDVAQEGIYAPVLAEEIVRSGQMAEMVFATTQKRVYRTSSERQKPWSDNRIFNDICFAGCEPTTSAFAAAAVSDSVLLEKNAAPAAPVLQQTEQCQGEAGRYAVGAAYIQAIMDGSGARQACGVDFEARQCRPDAVWDEACQGTVFENMDGKTSLMSVLAPGTIARLIPASELRRVYADQTDPTYADARSMIWHLSTAGNGWFNQHEGEGGVKQLLRQYVNSVDPIAIGSAYAQAILAGPGSRQAGIVDFDRLGCRPETVWEDTACQQNVVGAKDGKSFMMNVLKSANINQILPLSDLGRIYSASATPGMAETQFMLENLSDAGNGWFAELEGPNGAKAVLRNHIAAAGPAEIGRAYFQTISGGNGVKQAKGINFPARGCSPQTVWEPECQDAVAGRYDGKTLMMMALTPANISTILPPADLQRIYANSNDPSYQNARAMLDNMSTHGNGWFAQYEGPGQQKTLLRDHINRYR